MKKLLKRLFAFPSNPGVDKLADFLNIRAFLIYEMISQMSAEKSKHFLSELNLHYVDRAHLYNAAKVFVIYTKLDPNGPEILRKGRYDDSFSLDSCQLATDDDLKIAFKLLPHLNK